MRLAVLSDIHGNLPALQAVLNDLQGLPIDGYILAGDYYAGPQGSQTRQILRELPGWKISGNGEVNLCRYAAGELPQAWHTDQQFALHRWMDSCLEPADWAFIHQLPAQQIIHIPGTAPIRVVHGSHRSPFEEIFPAPSQVQPNLDPGCAFPSAGSPWARESNQVLEAVFNDTSEAVFICGHTHIAWVVQQDGRLAVNPGAVCSPLNGFASAQYALLTWQAGCWQAELHAVPYNLNEIRRAFEESGLFAEGGALARAFLASIETGCNISRDFLGLAYQLAAEMGYQGSEFVPDEAWQAAAQSFPWPDRSV